MKISESINKDCVVNQINIILLQHHDYDCVLKSIH